MFAGSGSLAIEALSRGAASATLVEQDPAAVDVIRQNLAACGFEAIVVKGSLPDALDRVEGPFDLVFVDPPYRLSLASVLEILELAFPLVAMDATVMVHRRKGDGGLAPVDGRVEGFGMEDDRLYGDSHIVRLRKRGDE